MVAALAELDTLDPLEDRLRSRIGALKENRERFVQEARTQLAALDAAIGEMSALLEPASLNGHQPGGDGDGQTT
jgi:transcription elongation GreA/GreB family factor